MRVSMTISLQLRCKLVLMSHFVKEKKSKQTSLSNSNFQVNLLRMLFHKGTACNKLQV